MRKRRKKKTVTPIFITLQKQSEDAFRISLLQPQCINIVFSARSIIFVATNTYCGDKHATKAGDKIICRNEICLSRQNVCGDKNNTSGRKILQQKPLGLIGTGRRGGVGGGREEGDNILIARLLPPEWFLH